MKKIIIIYLFVVGLIALGVWLDWDRKTESYTVSFDSHELPQRRDDIENTWKQAHPNVKDPQFGYYGSHGKIVAYFVNYY